MRLLRATVALFLLTAGIACGDNCSGYFQENSSITLTPQPGEGSIFSGWSGDCGGDEACQVTMDNDKSVTANFDLELIEPAYEISLPLVNR